MATDATLNSQIVPVSAVVGADELLALVDPLLDQFDVSNNPIVREARRVLMLTTMAECLRVSSRRMLHQQDAEELRWLADAVLLTVSQERTDRRKHQLANAVGCLVFAIVAFVGAVLVLGRGDSSSALILGVLSICFGGAGLIGSLDWWRSWLPSIRSLPGGR